MVALALTMTALNNCGLLGGIGIAPFLNALANIPKDKKIALVYSFRDRDISIL